MKIAKLYKNKYEKDKYFIFLDLVQPADFNFEEERYRGYKFVSYENILNILKKTLKKKAVLHRVRYTKGTLARAGVVRA